MFASPLAELPALLVAKRVEVSGELDARDDNSGPRAGGREKPRAGTAVLGV